MFPSNLPAMIWFEIQVVFRRGSGLATLGVSLLVGLLSLLLMYASARSMGSLELNGASVESMVGFSGADCASWALWGRNFFVLPMLLLFATGSSVAGELQERSLREALIRPVPRWGVLLAKLSALMLLSAASLILTLLPSLLIGMAMFGTDGPTTDVLLGYAASLGTDLGIIGIGFLASTILSNVAGVVVLVVLMLMLDGGVRTILWAYESALTLMQHNMDAPVEPTLDIAPFLPGSALECWRGSIEGWSWEPFVGLFILVTVSYGLALFRFQRMDIS